MQQPIILRTDAELNMGASVMTELAAMARIVTAEDDRPETILRHAPEADIIFTCYAPITAEAINAAGNLRGIMKYGVGVDSIDLEAATARRIPVVHCPDYGTGTVADQAFALLMALARKTLQIDRGMRKSGWLWPAPAFLGAELGNKVMGIVGLGRIGSAMAQRALGFGMKVLVHDPYVENDALDFVSLDELVERADFLSLHCVLTPETRGMISAQRLRRMKRSAIIVNVSRGALIDQHALVEALEKGEIAGAGLDVFVEEPLSADHPLYRFDNVVCSPHFAFYTREALERLERQCCDKIRVLLAGGIPQDLKNRAILPEDDSSLVTEGDINLSQHRRQWQDDHLDETTRELLKDDAQVFVHQSLSTPCLNTLSGCEGIYLIDGQGRRIMDFHGNSAHQVGYSHPRVLEAMKVQLDALSFCPRRFTNQPAVDLAEKLAALAPGPLNKVLLTPAGTAAVGIAMKVARYITGRHKTISMIDSFHGASLDAISVGGEALFRDGLGPLLPGCFHVPWPKTEKDADAIEKILVEQKDIGAVIAEPMRCTTVEYPEASYWQRVRKLCDEHGALLVFDEIPLALGRTGKMFCCEHSGVTPDVLVIGKGLGGAVMPLAAVIVREDFDVLQDRALGHYTHEKSPVASAAALATIQVIEEEGLLEHSRVLGEEALRTMSALKARHPVVADTRGLGLALAMEVGDDSAERILYDCLSNGLSFKISAGNILTLTPPLIITSEQLAEAFHILESAIG